MLLDEPERLAHLIRLCLPAVILEVQRFTNGGVHEKVVAAARPIEREAQRLDKADKIREADVCLAGGDALKESARLYGGVHSTGATPRDARPESCLCRATYMPPGGAQAGHPPLP